MHSHGGEHSSPKLASTADYLFKDSMTVHPRLKSSPHIGKLGDGGPMELTGWRRVQAGCIDEPRRGPSNRMNSDIGSLGDARQMTGPEQSPAPRRTRASHKTSE